MKTYCEWNKYPGTAPPKLCRVLVTTDLKYDAVQIGMHDGIEWLSAHGYRLRQTKVLAWMPLPEPADGPGGIVAGANLQSPISN